MSEEKEDRPHAPCSPSVLKRRMECSGSLALESALPRVESDSASIGTRLHKLLEKDAWTQKDLEGLPPFHLDALNNAKQFMESVLKPNDKFEIHKELWIDLSFIHPLVGGGYCDLVLVEPFRRAIIADWKFFFQKDTDPARTNIQIQAYAAGVARNFEVSEVEAHLYMPHTNLWSNHTFSVKYLQDFAGMIRGSMEWNELNPFNFKEGTHCNYCRAVGVCPIWIKKAIEGKEASKKATKAEPKELPDLLDLADDLGKWAGGIKQYAYQQAMSGKKIPGWGLVQGYGHRKWKDEKEAETILIDLAKSKQKDPESLYDPKTLKSPSAVEGVLGKSKPMVAAIEPLVTKPLGEMKLERLKEEKKA